MGRMLDVFDLLDRADERRNGPKTEADEWNWTKRELYEFEHRMQELLVNLDERYPSWRDREGRELVKVLTTEEPDDDPEMVRVTSHWVLRRTLVEVIVDFMRYARRETERTWIRRGARSAGRARQEGSGSDIDAVRVAMTRNPRLSTAAAARCVLSAAEGWHERTPEQQKRAIEALLRRERRRRNGG